MPSTRCESAAAGGARVEAARRASLAGVFCDFSFTDFPLLRRDSGDGTPPSTAWRDVTPAASVLLHGKARGPQFGDMRAPSATSMPSDAQSGRPPPASAEFTHCVARLPAQAGTCVHTGRRAPCETQFHCVSAGRVAGRRTKPRDTRPSGFSGHARFQVLGRAWPGALHAEEAGVVSEAGLFTAWLRAGLHRDFPPCEGSLPAQLDGRVDTWDRAGTAPCPPLFVSNHPLLLCIYIVNY